MKNKYLYVSLLTMLALSSQAQQQKGITPRLVVSITIDQLRNDYPALFDDGIVYEEGFNPYSQPDMASAISSVITGTSPFYHTITADRWFDRSTLQTVTATPADIAVSTLSDELKMATKGAGKVCSAAIRKEIAELAAGHHADRIIWNEEKKKKWNAIDLTTKALQLIDKEGLGQDSIPDLLLLTYDENYSNEALTKLVTEIENLIGKHHALFVITSTGYEEENTDEYAKYGIPTGVYYTNRTANLLNMYLGALYGQGKYVEGTYRNQLYLNHQLIDSKRLTLGEIAQKATDFLLQMSGVKKVETHLYEQHIGDLVVELNPGWQMQNDDTHEQMKVKKPLAYFPIIFYGANITAQKVKIPVSIERIAPTIAKAIRIRAPNACMTTPLF
ncbi:MAG: alkaline phosphatase family protein [Prevotella sp.]|nr:alkaline phosphatase family protein [Prevotella sp.]